VGEASAALDPAGAAALLRASATALRGELTGLSPALLAWHPAPGEWCAKEVVGHLIEAEQRGFAGRIRQIVATSETPRFAAWEPAEVARSRCDCAREIDGLLREFDALRDASVSLVRSLQAADLGRGGEHPSVGYLRVGDLLHEWVHHDRNHIMQILANVQAFVWPHMGNAQRFSRP
jgi:DinB superfamily